MKLTIVIGKRVNEFQFYYVLRKNTFIENWLLMLRGKWLNVLHEVCLPIWSSKFYNSIQNHSILEFDGFIFRK